MTRSPRPAAVGVALALLGSVAVAVGAGATTRNLPHVPSPLTVAQAHSLWLDDQVLVQGFLVSTGEGTVLCDRRPCRGPTLLVRGLRHRPRTGRAVVLGWLEGDAIRAVPLARRSRAVV